MLPDLEIWGDTWTVYAYVDKSAVFAVIEGKRMSPEDARLLAAHLNEAADAVDGGS